jgi:hypothetical protein
VRLGPSVPLKGKRATGSDGGSLGTRGTALVAGNVRGRVVGRADEAVVLVVSAPRDTGGGAADHATGVALVLGAINVDADDAAVSVSQGGERAHKGSLLHDRHVVGLVGGNFWFSLENAAVAGVGRMNELISPGYQERVAMVLDQKEGYCAAEMKIDRSWRERSAG